MFSVENIEQTLQREEIKKVNELAEALEKLSEMQNQMTDLFVMVENIQNEMKKEETE